MEIRMKYQHDCDQCRFLGTFLDLDVYVCGKFGPRSIIARFGDDGSDYASMPLEFLKGLIGSNRTVDIPSEHRSMPYQQYVFSQWSPSTSQAMILALAYHGEIP